MAKLTKTKAKTILAHGEVKGHKLTEKQERFFAVKAYGGKKSGKK